jgi:tetratricopeptide (TPR) repeat protein
MAQESPTSNSTHSKEKNELGKSLLLQATFISLCISLISNFVFYIAFNQWLYPKIAGQPTTTTAQPSTDPLTSEQRQEVGELIDKQKADFFAMVAFFLLPVASGALFLARLIVKEDASYAAEKALKKDLDKQVNEQIQNSLKVYLSSRKNIAGLIEEIKNDVEEDLEPLIELFSLAYSIYATIKLKILPPVLVVGTQDRRRLDEQERSLFVAKDAVQSISQTIEKYLHEKMVEHLRETIEPVICEMKGDILYVEAQRMRSKLSLGLGEFNGKADGIFRESIARYEEFLRAKRFADQQNLTQQELDEVLRILCKKGNAFANLGENERAIGVYQDALALDSNDSWKYWLLHSIGDAYFNIGGRGYEQAYIEYDKAIEIARKNPQVDASYQTYYRRGITLAAKGQYEKAIEDYNRALNQVEDSEDHRIFLALGEANHMISKGRDPKILGVALECFKKSLAIKPGDSDSKFKIGRVYFDLKEYIKSYRVLESEKLRNHDNHAWFWYYYGSVLHKIKPSSTQSQEAFSKALSILEDKEKQNQDDPDIHYQRAIYHALKGESLEAQIHLSMACSLNTDCEVRAKYEPALVSLDGL